MPTSSGGGAPALGEYGFLIGSIPNPQFILSYSKLYRLIVKFAYNCSVQRGPRNEKAV